MIKYIAILILAIMPLYAESIDKMEQRFIDEINACGHKVWLSSSDERIQCQLKVNNKLMLMLLIEQMKEKK